MINREDIIRMAREAGIIHPEMVDKTLERFAALVAAAVEQNASLTWANGLLEAVRAEREACAELVWPTQQVKVWSDEELTGMTGAFNRAQEKHGWYETIMAVGAAALKDRAAAIRARGETK